jgi:hypothetical protein
VVVFAPVVDCSSASSSYVADTPSLVRFYSHGGVCFIIYNCHLDGNSSATITTDLKIDGTSDGNTERVQNIANDGICSISYAIRWAKGWHTVQAEFKTNAGTINIPRRTIMVREL